MRRVAIRRVVMGRIGSDCRKSDRMKKQLLMTVVIFTIVLTAFFVGGNLLHTHQAKASSAYEEVVCYKSVRVNEGDSLWSLADRYRGGEFQDIDSYITEVKRLNHLTSDTIHAGSYLLVPYIETVSGL